MDPLIAIINVKVENALEQICIYRNDQIDKVARDFCRQFNINEAYAAQIEQLIHSEIQKSHSKSFKLQNESSSTSTKDSLLKPANNNHNLTDFDFAKDRHTTPPELFNKHDSSKALQDQYEKWHQLIKEKQEDRKHLLRKSNNQNNNNKPAATSRSAFKQFISTKPGLDTSPLRKGADPPQRKAPPHNTSMKRTSPSPTSNQFLQRMALNQYKKEQHLHQLRKEYHRNQDEQTGQELFQPVITKDEIYWSVKSRQDQEDLQLSKAGFGGEFLQVIPVTRERLEMVFRLMDEDGDGRISQDRIELRGVGESDLKQIKEVLFDMEDNNLTLDLNSFLASCRQKGLIISGKQQQAVVEKKKKPSISPRKCTTPKKVATPCSKTAKTAISPASKKPLSPGQFGQLPARYQKLLSRLKEGGQ